MNPVAFELFGYPIRWYGIIIAGGVLVAFFISYILAKKKGLDFDIITDGFLWSFPFAIIGARLYYVAFEYKNYHSFHLQIKEKTLNFVSQAIMKMIVF